MSASNHTNPAPVVSIHSARKSSEERAQKANIRVHARRIHEIADTALEGIKTGEFDADPERMKELFQSVRQVCREANQDRK